MASSTQNKHATKRLQYKLMCFLVIPFVIAYMYQRKTIQELLSSFFEKIIAPVIILLVFVAGCAKASEQTDSSKSNGGKTNQSQRGDQGHTINNNSGSGPSSTAYRNQGVGSTFNAKREAGTRAPPSRPSVAGAGPSQPNGYCAGDHYSTFSANQHAQNLPGLTPELSQMYQQRIDTINRQYYQEMDRIKRQHSYALNQNQLAFEHQHYLYMQHQEQRRQQQQQQQQQQHQRQQQRWQHYQQPPRQERRPKPRRSSRSLRLKKHYDVLGIRSDASANEIRQAYRKGALRWHPDKPGGSGEKFRQVREAYEILSEDRERRRAG